MQDAYVQNLANRVATDTDGVHAVLRSSSLTMMELQSGRSPCVTICVVTAPLVGRIRECRVRDGLPTPGVQPSSRGPVLSYFFGGNTAVLACVGWTDHQSTNTQPYAHAAGPPGPAPRQPHVTHTLLASADRQPAPTRGAGTRALVRCARLSRTGPRDAILTCCP
jgi:hypothetical protein